MKYSKIPMNTSASSKKFVERTTWTVTSVETRGSRGSRPTRLGGWETRDADAIRPSALGGGRDGNRDDVKRSPDGNDTTEPAAGLLGTIGRDAGAAVAGGNGFWSTAVPLRRSRTSSRSSSSSSMADKQKLHLCKTFPIAAH